MKKSNKSSAEQIKNFINHLYATSNKVSDFYHDGIQYNKNDFNIKISCDGKEIEIDLNADFTVALDKILQDEIDYMEEYEKEALND